MKSLVSTIRTDKLRKVYGGRQVVSDVSISVSQGEIVGLLGPNGAGKTTSFYMIVGMVRPDSGHIFLDDIEMTEITEKSASSTNLFTGSVSMMKKHISKGP